MTFSPLTKIARISTKRSSRGGRKVERVIIHHIAGSGAAGVATLYNPSRQASANYILFENGDLQGMVPEEYRAWTSGSAAADGNSITVETANTTFAPSWKVSDASIETLAKLVADVAKRYKWKEITRKQVCGHREFQSTACPGPYLYPRLNDIVKRANEIWKGKPAVSKPVVKPSPKPSTSVSGSLVEINTTSLNYRSGPGVSYKVNGSVRKGQIYTIVEKKNGWGKLKSGAGWINLGFTKPLSKGKEKVKSVNALAREVIAGKWGTGGVRKQRLEKAGYSYAAVQREVNRLL